MQEWRHLFRGFVQHGGEHLERLARTDGANAAIVRSQLLEISASLGELDYYSSGQRITMSEFVELVKKGIRGDKEAEEKANQIIAWQEEHQDDLIGTLHENWRNGFGIVRALLNKNV